MGRAASHPGPIHYGAGNRSSVAGAGLAKGGLHMFKLYDQPFPDGDYRYVQLGYVVADIEATVWAWADLHGVGPFLFLPDAEHDAPYQGRTVHMRYRTAVTQMGPLQMELIEDCSDEPNYYSDVVPRGQTAPHHISTTTTDFDAALAHYAEHGLEPVTTFDGGAYGRVAYIDTRATIGLHTEVLEYTDAMFRGLRGTERRCRDWDGTDPVRIMRPDGGYDALPRP